MSEPIPFPNGSPKLPDMTPAERRLWAASHNLPSNMLIVTEREMYEMKASFDACLREIKEWRRMGRMYMAGEIPESFEPNLRAYMAAKEALDKKVKELTASITELRARPAVKAETSRPDEL